LSRAVFRLAPNLVFPFLSLQAAIGAHSAAKTKDVDALGIICDVAVGSRTANAMGCDDIGIYGVVLWFCGSCTPRWVVAAKPRHVFTWPSACAE